MLDKTSGLYPIMLKDEYGDYYIADIPISRCIVLESFDTALEYAIRLNCNINDIICAKSCYYPNRMYK